MSIPPAFYDALATALMSPAPLAAARAVARAEADTGTERETLVAWFEVARERFPDHEDLLLGVLDFVTGWCSPHMAVAATRKSGEKQPSDDGGGV